PDGKKEFDLSLLFDLHDIDRKLVECVKLAPAESSQADAHAHRSRLAFEEGLLSKPVDETLAAIERGGDAGSVAALRLVLARSPTAAQVERISALAKKLGLEAPLAAAVRERLWSAGPFPGAPGLGADAELLPLLARLDSASSSTR